MSLTPRADNPFGDFQITDPRAMRALSHPVRLRILGQLQSAGPSTATALAPVVGASPSVTSWHLRHLQSFGLVRDAEVGADGRQRWWEAVARGFRFDLPDDDEGREAFRLLSGQMFLQYEHLPRQWIQDVAPHLSAAWSAQVGLSNTRIVVTPDELAGIGAAIEVVLAPYVQRRGTSTVPSEARSVRLMRYVLPQGDVSEARS